MPPLSRARILRLFDSLNEELERAGVHGIVHLAGGAVMCLALRSRDATHDVDAVFEPSGAVLDAALRVAERENVADSWLNNAVKGYLSDHGEFDEFIEHSNLRIFVANPKYMLAMKCMAMRVGEGYHDEEDVRYLLRHLGIEDLDEAQRVISGYYPLRSFPTRALDALGELLSSGR